MGSYIDFSLKNKLHGFNQQQNKQNRNWNDNKTVAKLEIQKITQQSMKVMNTIVDRIGTL